MNENPHNEDEYIHSLFDKLIDLNTLKLYSDEIRSLPKKYRFVS